MFLHPWAPRQCKICNQYRPQHSIFPGAERPSPPVATINLSSWSEADGEERAGHPGTACNESLAILDHAVTEGVRRGMAALVRSDRLTLYRSEGLPFLERSELFRPKLDSGHRTPRVVS
jgi:hypothetical protein